MYEEKGLTELALSYQPWLPFRKGLRMSQLKVVLIYIIYLPVLNFLKQY